MMLRHKGRRIVCRYVACCASTEFFVVDPPLLRQLCAAHDQTHMQNHPKRGKKKGEQEKAVRGGDRDGVLLGGFTYI